MPRVWLLDKVNQPFVWGLVRGSIYLPVEMIKEKRMKFHTSLIGHELSHVIRLDALINSLQIIAQTVFWFHPFIWWTNRKIRIEREKCCDEMTIARMNTLPEVYSEAIVDILAAKYERVSRIPSLAVAGKVKNIEERIKIMLSPGKKFYKRPTIKTIVVLLLVALVSIPIGYGLSRPSEENQGPVVKDFYTGLQRPDGIVCLDKDNLVVIQEAYSPGIGIINCKRGDTYSSDDVFSGLGAPYNNPDGLIQLPDGRFIVTDGQASTIFEVPKEGGPPKVFLSDIFSYSNPAIAPSDFDGPNVDPGDLLIPQWKPASIIAVNPTTKEKKNFVDHSFFSSFCEQGAGSLEFGPDNKLYMSWSNDPEDRKPPRIYRFDSNGNGEIFLELKDFAYRISGSNIEIDQKNNWLYYVHDPIQPSPYSGQGTIFRISLDKSKTELVCDLGLPCQNIELSPDGENLYIGIVGRENVIKEIQNVNLLSEYGAVIGLIPAINSGNIERVKSLISEEIDQDSKNAALQEACSAGQLDIVKFMIENGADVNAKNNSGGTPLNVASQGDNRDIVELLIENGANINNKNNNGLTPLHQASRNGQKDIVELLIAKGTEVNIKNNAGRTPLDLAEQGGYTEIVELLREHGAEE